MLTFGEFELNISVRLLEDDRPWSLDMKHRSGEDPTDPI